MNIESTKPLISAEQEEEGQVPMVKSETAIIVAKRLSLLSIAEGLMSMSIIIDVSSDASSSSPIVSSYGLGPTFLKETHS